MVFILDGNSYIGAHVRSNLCYLICLRHLIRSKEAQNKIFVSFTKYLFSFMRAQHVLSYHRNGRLTVIWHLIVDTGWTVYFRKSVLYLLSEYEHVLKQMQYRFAVIYGTLSCCQDLRICTAQRNYFFGLQVYYLFDPLCCLNSLWLGANLKTWDVR